MRKQKLRKQQVHLEVAFRHGYLNKTAFDEFDDGYEKVIGAARKDD